MPELPEVETTKTSLQPLLGQTVSRVNVYQPKLRWQMPTDLDALVGYRLTDIKRRAKYLILTFTMGDIVSDKVEKADKDEQSKEVIIHLGMSGSLQQYPEGSDKRKHDHLIIQFLETATQLHYHDPRRFGAILWADDDNQYRKRLFDHLGVEPLTDTFSADYLYHYIQQKQTKPISRAIKSVIMEQKVVVGVGNIYASESLFMSGIHPATPAHLIGKKQLELLVAHIKSILSTAIDKGGSSLRDFTTGEGKTGYFQQTLLVYGREGEPCLNCQSRLENTKINGRASVFCPKCQLLLNEDP